MLRRLLNELPTIAVIVAGIVGLSESDAEVWKEAATAASALIVWLTARANLDGPATYLDQRAQERREQQATWTYPDR